MSADEALRRALSQSTIQEFTAITAAHAPPMEGIACFTAAHPSKRKRLCCHPEAGRKLACRRSNLESESIGSPLPLSHAVDLSAVPREAQNLKTLQWFIDFETSRRRDQCAASSLKPRCACVSHPCFEAALCPAWSMPNS